LPLIQFTYSRVNPVAVKSLARVLGLPAGELRKPYLNMTGQALRRGVEIVQRLGLAEQYGYRIRENLIGEDAAGAVNTAPAAVAPQTGSGRCFLR
jgi:4-hydroxy-tetrahydrodipicolinate synthase